MPSKRPASSSSAPKSKRQKTQCKSSLKGILLQPDYSHFTRKCKVSSFLNEDYKEYRQILRKLAEEFSLSRANAMNLGLLIISNSIEKRLKVAQDHNGLDSRIKLINVIDECYEKFNATIKCSLTTEYLYEIPVLDSMHIALAGNYTDTIIQNISIHLTRNVRLYLYRTLLSFLRNTKEQQNSTYNERSIANKAADGVIQYKKFEYLDIQIDRHLGKFLEYISIFLIKNTKKTSDYDYAKNNSYKLLCLSSQLLKEAVQYNIKTWSTLPRPNHGIVFAPLSGSDCMYGLLEQAHKSNLKTPSQCLMEEYGFETHRRETTLIWPTNFKDSYGSIMWQDELWETLFNIKHEQSKRCKPNEERIPQYEKEMNLLKSRVNLTNWSKGLCPLKEEPTGLSMTDRIVGIDPGLLDIFVMADGSSEDVKNKKAVKERSVKFASNEYK
ncbi:hypothetical protein BCV71DRAFT_289915 [Rhizopus microsporus]|uniref:Uncharacterized protein n=1 Tax=Rhizopus microsporus TaxID=58291 RepID=A0A1X0S6H3_RHIZD|nr:hypothetical protein BCV71DRAFT_289915 [Rhizopus microsporus]